MFIQYVYHTLILIFLKQIISCPIPFNIQSKCRCAITETGRVYIYCARKQLTVIPHFDNSNIIFDELVLSGNRISIVHKNAFNGLKLRKLELQSNPIEIIENKAFIDLANYLEEFILSTTITTSQLTSHTFLQILSELPNLKRLSLRLFNLSNPLNIYNYHNLILRKLTQLSLQSCSIKQINDIEIFSNLFPNLERLDLSENRLEYFNIPLISSLKKLKILILSKNKIRHLNIHPLLSTTTFNPSNSLIELDLSYNGIETIDENIFELISSQLEILNLRNNELLTEKHLTFLIHLNRLREFYLDYNRLESINQLNFPLNLKILSLKNNYLNQIDLSILTRLEYLEKLFLSSNKLTKLSLKYKHIFPSLEVLELDRNHLSSILSLNAPKLKQLNLDGNHLGRKIDKKIFSNLPSLEKLHLRDNHIEFIDNNAFHNTRLQILDLKNNSLKTFPLITKLNETLQILSLRRNQICTIDQHLINFYQNLHTLELDQNPLHCDCRLKRDFKQIKITGQCQSPPERRNINLNELPNEQFACSMMTTPQCSYLTKLIIDSDTDTTTIVTATATATATATTTTKTTIVTTTVMDIIEELVDNIDEQQNSFTTITTTIDNFSFEYIRIGDLTIIPNIDKSKLLIQWQLLPSIIDENSNDEYRRVYLKDRDISGFKISSNFPIYKMSELLDILQRNYTLDYIQQGEICLYLLYKINYEKFCKQLQLTSTQTLKSSFIIDPNQQQQQQEQSWYMNEPTKSIFVGSMFGILFILILLTSIILMISRCSYLSFCHSRSSKYHQNNDSKSESLLVRPTPTNTIPWPMQSQQHFYPPPPHHQLRPVSYQTSISTQCTCPTHYHSSGSSSTDAGSSCTHGQNYHIYQEIINDDLNTTNISNNHRTCRPLKIDTNSPLTSSTNTTMNSEQCQLCSLSVLV
ncbi:unnamed protein product [Rotaria sordida]|uniref:SWIM-type domain-containing protein n=1 Tax=Rotaria sordida TaxID=392033 RepID=A0A813X8R1_9BILA|nr:unnamed protein product [Rotaria sordida]CAF3617350.1 unnamed protein product [Rotaria sordida]